MRLIGLLFLLIGLTSAPGSCAAETELPRNAKVELIKACNDFSEIILDNRLIDAKELLLAQPDLVECPSDYWSILGLIVERGTIEQARFLLENGASPNGTVHQSEYNDSNASLRTPLMEAISDKKPEMVELMLKHGANIQQQNYSGWAAIHYAARSTIEMIKLILQAGGDLQSVSFNGATPLHLAVMKGKRENVLYLLDKGADIEAKDFYGRTPLDLAACGYGGIEMLITLLDRKADLKALSSGCAQMLHGAARIYPDVDAAISQAQK